MTTNSLRIDDLHVGYGKAQVLVGLSLEVGEGEIVGVAGPNGAGKTTLLRAISGLISRQNGTMTFGGDRLPRRPEAVVRRGVVHVPENRHLFGTLTVQENLRIGALGARVKVPGDAIERVKNAFPALEPLMARRAGVLSGGQQQMAALARGLAAQPRALLVDELSLGLSPKMSAELSESLVQICRAEGTSVILVDQNVSLLAKNVDRMMALRDGRLEQITLEDARSRIDLF